MSIQNEAPAWSAPRPLDTKAIRGDRGSEISNPAVVTQARVLNFKPFVKNTLRGFFDLGLPFGMILRDCMFCEKDGKRWIGWPAKSYDKKDGSKSWSNIVDFVDNKSKYLFQDEVLPLVLAAMAEAGR
jgi:hypothetical protein